MFKIVVQPIAFKGEHLWILVGRFLPAFPPPLSRTSRIYFPERGSYSFSRFSFFAPALRVSVEEVTKEISQRSELFVVIRENVNYSYDGVCCLIRG